MRGWRAVWLLALGLAVVGCESETEEPAPIGGEAAQPAEDEDEPSDDAGDDGPHEEWAVPDEVDEAYVERVADHLLSLERELFLAVLAEGGNPGDPVSEEVEDLSAQYRHPDLGLPRATIDERLRASPEIFDTGDSTPRFHADGLLSTQEDCLSAHGRYDFDGLIDEQYAPDPETSTAIIGLVPAPAEVDEERNPTGWVFLRVSNTSEDPPPDPCEER